MNITFDKGVKQLAWQSINNAVADRKCPFCGIEITGKNFAGAAFIDGEFRCFDGNIVCLIQLSDHLKEAEK